MGAIAKAAVDSIKTFLVGDFTALLGMADTLENKVLRMGWSTDESSERKASVEYEEGTGMYAVVIIERQSSSKDVKQGGGLWKENQDGEAQDDHEASAGEERRRAGDLPEAHG